MNISHIRISKAHMNLRDVNTMSEEELHADMADCHDKLDRATDQIKHLDEQIAYLKKHFRRAVKNDGYAVRYNLRMQLSISSGVKVMYHHYCATMGLRISEVMRHLNISDDSPIPSPTSFSPGTSEESADGGTETASNVHPLALDK